MGGKGSPDTYERRVYEAIAGKETVTVVGQTLKSKEKTITVAKGLEKNQNCVLFKETIPAKCLQYAILVWFCRVYLVLNIIIIIISIDVCFDVDFKSAIGFQRPYVLFELAMKC